MQAVLLSSALISSPSFAQTQNPQDLMRVISHELVSKKRVSRTEIEYEYNIAAENSTNTDYASVFAKASIDSPSVKIIDGRANIGQMNAFSSANATDTVTVRVDRRARFNPSNLTYVFDNATLEGIDANQNGVMDVLDVFFYTDPYEKVSEQEFATRLAKLIFSAHSEDGEIAQEAYQSAENFRLCATYLNVPQDVWTEVFYIANSTPARIERIDQLSIENGAIFIDGPKEEFCARKNLE